MNQSRQEPHFRRSMVWIFLLFLALGVSYIFATPPLEASDEYKHYPVVQYIQTARRLPILEPEKPGRWLQEGAQPPLYYLLMAALTAGIDSADLPQIYQQNPHAFVGNPNQIYNKNLMIHQPEWEKFPWHGAILAICLIRFVSLALGGGAVWLTAHLGRRLFDDHIGLLAAALTAFNPMFLFVSGAVNNDSLANLLGIAGIFGLVWLWQMPAFDWRHSGLIGLLIGLGALTKLSLGGLAIIAGIILLWRARGGAGWRWAVANGGAMAAAALLVVGWWLLRNVRLYGDLTGLSAFIAVQGTRTTAITWRGWLGEFGTFFRSFWGLFGGVNVAAPQPFYWLCNGLAIGGIVGWLRRNRIIKGVWGGRWLLSMWIVTLLLLLIRWNLISPAFQGRLVFPALGAWNILWAAGWLAWLPAAWRGKGGLALTAFFFLWAAALPFITIRPAYAYPTPLDAVPEAAQFGPIRFEGGLTLVGVEMPANQSIEWQTEQPIQATLYWTSDQPLSQDFVTSLHLIGREERSVGQVDRYPGWGMIPTSQWQPGQIWRDVYQVWARPIAEAPAQLRLNVGALDGESGVMLPAFSPDGNEIPFLLVGEPARLSGGQPQPIQTTLEADFQQGIQLLGYSIGEADPGVNLPITLHWLANETPDNDYTVFVHLLSVEGEQIAGADAPPLNNDYPTSLWQKGDRIDDHHILPLPAEMPAGRYHIRVGWYEPESGMRLSRVDSSEESVILDIEIGIK